VTLFENRLFPGFDGLNYKHIIYLSSGSDSFPIMGLMRKIGRIIVPVMMAVVIGFIANSTINQHYHRLSCGIFVKHSHPFEHSKESSPFQEHQHTTSEFLLFEHITNIGSWIGLLLFLLLILFFTGQRVIFLIPVSHKKSGYNFTGNYRAPPLSFL